MGPLFGAVFSLVGAAVFYSLVAYILTRDNRDVSHLLFAAMMFSSGTSEFLAFLEFTGSMERAQFLLRFDLSFLALASYFLLLFADYFREGFNRKFAIFAGVPTSLVICMVFTVMIKGMTMGPYGWAGVYNEICHIIYTTFGLSYLSASLAIFVYVRQTILSGEIKRKITIFIVGVSIVLIGGLVNGVVLVIWGRVFPILETSMMIFGIVFAQAFR